MSTIVVTGFEPFGEHLTNATGQAARALHGSTIEGARLVGLELPCRFDLAAARMQEALTQHEPTLVLALGLAPSRRGFSLERVALNLVDARIADNAGAQPVDQPVCAGAPPALFTTLPVKRMAAAMREAGWAAELSLSAGSYVCNHLFFSLLHAVGARTDLRAGFMHVGPELDAVAVVAGTRTALQSALAAAGPDLAASGGSID